MADIILTLQQLENAFQALTTAALGIALTDGNNSPINQDKVRIYWPSSGAPAFKRTDDVCFIQVAPKDSPLNRQKNRTYQSINGNTIASNQSMQYVNVHNIRWIFYGPSSSTNVYKVRDYLYSQAAYETLISLNLFTVMDIPAPRRFPEPFNGQWWERWDLEINVNESVTRNETKSILADTNIIITKG